jgi:hypothetical protein
MITRLQAPETRSVDRLRRFGRAAVRRHGKEVKNGVSAVPEAGAPSSGGAEKGSKNEAKRGKPLINNMLRESRCLCFGSPSLLRASLLLRSPSHFDSASNAVRSKANGRDNIATSGMTGRAKSGFAGISRDISRRKKVIRIMSHGLRKALESGRKKRAVRICPHLPAFARISTGAQNRFRAIRSAGPVCLCSPLWEERSHFELGAGRENYFYE